MVNETFVASDPKTAYEQAVKKYGEGVELISAKQIKYEDGKLRSEVSIAVPKDLFMEKSFGKISTENNDSEKQEDEVLLAELGELKKQLSLMKEEMLDSEDDSVMQKVKKLFIKKGCTYSRFKYFCIAFVTKK